MKFSKENVKGIVIGIGAALAIILAIIIGAFSTQAKAIAYEEKVTEARSAINVQEKARADLIPNLVDCVKAYDKHEYQTLVDLVNARRGQDGTISDDLLNDVKETINVVIENYPDLESQKNYQQFMYDLSTTEHKIAETREAYNKTVSRYNTYTRNPFNKFFLSLTGYEKVEFEKLTYEVSSDAPTNLFD